MSNDKNQSEVNAPDLGTLATAGRNAGAAAEPEAIDLTSVGGVRIPSPPAGGEHIDLSALYGPFGGPVE
jgi:hypothetical protein